MSKLYRSPYEAYPFLSDASDDFRCDFELLTDELASRTGLLLAELTSSALAEYAPLCEELLWICELIYHMNPTLRTHLSVTKEECARLKTMAERLQAQTKMRCEKFVLPAGGRLACEAHILRVQCKNLVRLLYRHLEDGHAVPDLLFDLANLLSGYFFFLALLFNKLEEIEEIPFLSRNYR
ncbi:MAG: ATP:cob(I)alamin adenosyltransferase [Roseburia sp.]